MIDADATPTLEEREQALAALRSEHAAALVALEGAEAALAPADKALAEAQQVYDLARADVGAAMAAEAPHGLYEEWTPKPAEQTAAEADALREARSVFDAAEAELGRRLVARNALDQRRSNLLMHRMALEQRISQAEGELERARRSEPAPGGHDVLASIRRRLGFGHEPGAA